MPIRKAILVKSVVLGTHYLFGQTLPPDYMDHKPAEIESFEKKCRNFGGGLVACTNEITKFLSYSMCVQKDALHVDGLKKQSIFHGEIKNDLIFEIYNLGNGEYRLRIESVDGIYTIKKVQNCELTE